MKTRTRVKTFTAARLNGYSVRFVAELKNRGRIEDAGWGHVYLEDVAEYRASHPDTPPYAQPKQQAIAA